MPKKVLIALPPAMLGAIDQIAENEHRTRSDLIRESLRRYMEEYRHKHYLPINSPIAASPAEVI
jgi:metal-responsive CopG/Arc/MetJ family transcriptional regulator